jgi:hypothetical protein
METYWRVQREGETLWADQQSTLQNGNLKHDVLSGEALGGVSCCKSRDALMLYYASLCPLTAEGIGEVYNDDSEYEVVIFRGVGIVDDGDEQVAHPAEELARYSWAEVVEAYGEDRELEIPATGTQCHSGWAEFMGWR